VGLRGEYTDNRDAWEEADAEENFDFYVIPRVDWVSQGEQTMLDLYYAPSFRYRTDPSDVQNDTELQHSLGLQLGHEFSPRLVGRLHERFDYTDDPSLSEGGRTIRADRSYKLNRCDGSLETVLGRRTKLEVGGAHTIKRYDEAEVADTSDEDRLDGNLTLRHYLTKTLNLNLFGGYSLFGYDSPGNIERDFDSAIGALGVENMLSQNLSIGAQAGAQYLMYENEGIDNGTSPYVKVFVRGSTTPSLKLGLEGTRAVRDADAYPYASQEYSEGRAVMNWAMTARFSLDLSGTYRLSTYSDVVPSAGTGVDEGDETTIDLFAQLGFKIADKSLIQLGQRYENIDSDPGVGTSFTKNTTTLAFNQQF